MPRALNMKGSQSMNVMWVVREPFLGDLDQIAASRRM
jgi:hypothetical protein